MLLVLLTQIFLINCSNFCDHNECDLQYQDQNIEISEVIFQCVVIGLQSTGEARTLEQLEEQGGELNDFVSTAKYVFLQSKKAIKYRCFQNLHVKCLLRMVLGIECTVTFNHISKSNVWVKNHLCKIQRTLVGSYWIHTFLKNSHGQYTCRYAILSLSLECIYHLYPIWSKVKVEKQLCVKFGIATELASLKGLITDSTVVKHMTSMAKSDWVYWLIGHELNTTTLH